MNKQEATELREIIMRKLPDGFSCSELVDMDQFQCPPECNHETWFDSWFYINSSENEFQHIMAIHSPKDWKLLKCFSLAYANNCVEDETERPFGAPSSNWIESQADQDYFQDVLHGNA